MNKVKVKGKRGSWFATANGEDLPCVHQHWYRMHQGKAFYHDPHFNADDRQWRDLVEGLKKSKRAVLTRDNQVPHGFDRTGYIAIWEIDNVSAEGSDLRFDFIKRIAEAC